MELRTGKIGGVDDELDILIGDTIIGNIQICEGNKLDITIISPDNENVLKSVGWCADENTALAMVKISIENMHKKISDNINILDSLRQDIGKVRHYVTQKLICEEINRCERLLESERKFWHSCFDTIVKVDE